MGKGLAIVNRMVMGGLFDDVLLGQRPEGGKEPTVSSLREENRRQCKQQMKRPRADKVPGMFKKYHHISRFPFTVMVSACRRPVFCKW